MEGTSQEPRVIFKIILSANVQHDLLARSAGDCSTCKLTVYTHEAEEVFVKRKSSLVAVQESLMS